MDELFSPAALASQVLQFVALFEKIQSHRSQVISVKAVNNGSAFSVTVFEHDRFVSSTRENVRVREVVECSNVF